MVPRAAPGGVISQHPACHRLPRGGRAAEVTGRLEGDHLLAPSITNNKVWPRAAALTSMLTQQEVGRRGVLGSPMELLLGFFSQTVQLCRNNLQI